MSEVNYLKYKEYYISCSDEVFDDIVEEVIGDKLKGVYHGKSKIKIQPEEFLPLVRANQGKEETIKPIPKTYRADNLLRDDD